MPTQLAYDPSEQFGSPPKRRKHFAHDLNTDMLPSVCNDLYCQESQVAFTRIASGTFSPVSLHQDYGWFSAGDDRGESRTFLPSIQFDGDELFHGGNRCSNKLQNRRANSNDRIHTFGSSPDVCNASFLGSLGLSHLNINSSSRSSSSGLPMKRHVSDTTDLDNQLFQQSADEYGHNQLQVSILDRDMPRSLDIISKASEFDDLNTTNFKGETALHLAVKTRQGEIVRKLMCAGASVSAEDNDRNTPLYLACELGDADIVRHLTSPIEYTEIRNIQYQLPYTAIPSVHSDYVDQCLKTAQGNGHCAIVEMLSEIM